MTNRELAAALRLCGSTITVKECRDGCPFYRGPDVELCIPKMTAACADALANSETHIAALQREIEKLRAQLEMARKPQWVSVEERLPKNDERVLALCKDDVIRDMRWNYPNWEWRDRLSGDAYFKESATHWMPLPEVPSTEGVK